METITKPALVDGNRSELFIDHAEVYFHNLSSCMISLSSFLFKGMNVYGTPLMEEPALIGFLLPVMLVLFVGLMNLVTGVIVQRALQMAEVDREAELFHAQKKRAETIPRLRDLFASIDADGSGSLDLDEIVGAPPEVQRALMELVKGDDIEELFNTIDQDESGEIELDEFINGLMRIVEGGQHAMEFLRTEKMLLTQAARMADLIHAVTGIKQGND